MYNDTVTLFNREAAANDGIFWRPTVLHRVDMNYTISNSRQTYGESGSDAATLHVPYSIEDGTIRINGKRYVPPVAWGAMQPSERASCITFQSGKLFDFFLLGEHAEDDPINDASYADGFFEYMRQTYDNVYAVASASVYSVIPHIEVAGR